VIKALRNYETARTNLEKISPTQQFTPRERAYFHSFSEWLADNVSKWTTTAEKPRTAVEKFFADLGQKLRMLVGKLMGTPYAPNEAVAEFLNRMGPDSAEAFLQQPDHVTDFVAVPESERKMTPQEYETASQMAVGDGLKKAEDFATNALTSVPWRNIGHTLRGYVLAAKTLTGMADDYGHILPSLHQLVTTSRDREVVKQRANQIANVARQMAADFESKSPKHQKLLNDVMQYGPIYGVDPEKTWVEQKGLHARPEMELIVNKANEDLRRLKQMGGHDAYRAMRDTHDFQHLMKTAITIFNAVRAEYGHDTPIAGFEQSPTEQFQHATELHENPLAAKDMANQILDQMVAGATAHADNLQNSATSVAGKDRALAKALSDKVTPLQAMLNDVRDQRARIAERPYFHLGREGSYFVQGHLKLGGDGNVISRDVDRLQEMLRKAGFGEVALNKGVSQTSVYMKVDTPEQLAELHKVMTEAKRLRLLQEDKPILHGEPHDPELLQNIAPSWMSRILENARQSTAFEPPEGATTEVRNAYAKARLDYEKGLRMSLLDMLPENSYAKVMQKREGVHGYTTNMTQAFAARAAVSSHDLANQHTIFPMDRAMTQMRTEVQGLKTGGDIDQTLKAQQVASEVALREAQRGWKAPPTAMIDHIRALNHSWFLAMSPAYMLQQVSQLPILTIPEMAKTHGFVNSSKAVAANTALAFKVMRAVWAGNHRWDVAITYDNLIQNGISKPDAKFVMGMVNRGLIDIGSFSREMAKASKTGGEAGYSKALRYANASATYAETFGRVLAGLAARDLHGKKAARGSLDQFVDHIVSQSMMDWGSWNTARALGKHGIIGQYTPLGLAFHGYQARLLEKLHHETAAAMGHRGTAAEQAEARTFLLNHLGAVAALSGTLGLPGTSMFLGVGSQLANAWTGKDDWDLEGSYRGYISDLFGKDVGEVIARGAGRAAGVDLTSWGEQDLIPLTKLLADRRAWKDKFPEWAQSMAGAPGSMANNMFLGAGEVLDGRVLQGLIKAAPRAIRDPLKGADLAAKGGYEDKNGTKLPIRVNPADPFLQAIGFKPSSKGEYDETKRADDQLKAAASARGQSIKQNYSLAVAHGDKSGMRSAMAEAIDMQRDHPGTKFVQGVATLPAKHAKEAALMRGMGMVGGQKLTDQTSRDKLRYGNFAP
jgi:hypothetical protein